MSTIVRDNLMTRNHYSPYCGDVRCVTMPRTVFNGTQFECKVCGWKSTFPEEFIEQYKRKWNIK